MKVKNNQIKNEKSLENAVKALDDLIVIVEKQLENYNIKYSQPPYSYFKLDYIKNLLIYIRSYKCDFIGHSEYLQSGSIEALPETIRTYKESYLPHFFADALTRADFALQMRPSPYATPGAKCLKLLPLLKDKDAKVINCKSNYVQWNGNGGMYFEI